LKSNAVALFVAFFLLLMGAAARLVLWGDASQSCAVAASLVDHGRVDLPTQTRVDVFRGPDGLWYSKYPLLPALACLPAAAVERWTGPGLGRHPLVLAAVPSALGAAMAVAFFGLLVALGASRRAALLITVAWMFTTPLWIYSRSLYGEVSQACAYAWLLWCAVRARASHGTGIWIALGASAGAALNARVALLIPAAGSLAYALWPWVRGATWPRKAALFSLGLAPGALVWAGYNALRYGSAWALGYAAERDGTLGFHATPMWAGVYGLLFSSGKSVFLYAPLLVLAALAAQQGWRRHRAEVVLLYGPALCLLCVAAAWWDWSGDWAWGPRLLVPALPALGASLAWISPSDGTWRRWAEALAAVGLAVQLLGAAIPDVEYTSLIHRMTGALYGAGDNRASLRDDLLLEHFVPEMSPIPGHAWLVENYLAGSAPPERLPWAGLRVPAWSQLGVNPVPKALNFWFWGDATASLVALVLAGLGAAGLWRSWRREVP